MLRSTCTRIVAACLVLVASTHAKTSHFERAPHIKRATSDQCVYLNKDMVPNINIGLGANIPDIFGNYNGCLCVANVPNIVSTYLPLSLAVSLVGRAATINWLTNYIRASTAVQTCIYPTGATSSCSLNNVCNFTCSNGLTTVGNSCQCVAPKTMCNGACTSAACPTGGLSRREAVLAKTGTLCPAGMERCGVSMSSSDRAYECLNTQRDLESCGGCVMPVAGEEATGKDCTAIPGVSDVECLAGTCNVTSCRKGWSVMGDGQSCEAAI